MNITIEVKAKCEGMTQKGLKCRKDATVYEPLMGALATIPEILSHTVYATFVPSFDKPHNVIPTGFRCDTHSRAGIARMWAGYRNGR
jgi:hypothetical protein